MKGPEKDRLIRELTAMVELKQYQPCNRSCCNRVCEAFLLTERIKAKP